MYVPSSGANFLASLPLEGSKLFWIIVIIAAAVLLLAAAAVIVILCVSGRAKRKAGGALQGGGEAGHGEAQEQKRQTAAASGEAGAALGPSKGPEGSGVVNTDALCFNCFRERCGGGSCPYCGYDPASDQGKYPLALKHGSILGGQYITGRVLGQGGFGITYLALDYSAKQKVAIKEYLPERMTVRISGTPLVTSVSAGQKEDFDYGAERFLEEAQVLAKFSGSPGIAAVRRFFSENGTVYFAMDYVDGISLKNYLLYHGDTLHRIPWQEALRILWPVMDALSAVHKEGFIHRDVTPDNIYITGDGGVKLLDFGSARYSLGDKSNSLDVILKAGYAPKEQYMRRGRQGPYTDVYSLCATFYTAITGYLPQEALERLDSDRLIPPSAQGCDIPAGLERAILTGLAVQPEERFQTVGALQNAIYNAVEKQPHFTGAGV